MDRKRQRNGQSSGSVCLDCSFHIALSAAIISLEVGNKHDTGSVCSVDNDTSRTGRRRFEAVIKCVLCDLYLYRLESKWMGGCKS
jgi:hypothetical protein